MFIPRTFFLDDYLCSEMLSYCLVSIICNREFEWTYSLSVVFSVSTLAELVGVFVLYFIVYLLTVNSSLEVFVLINISMDVQRLCEF